MILILSTLGAALAQDVLINEFVYDAVGTDGGNEWIELCNPGADPVDLTGWYLQTVNSSGWTEAYTFSAGTINPGTYLLIGYGSTFDAATFSPNLSNATSYTGGLRLVQAGGEQVSDTVLYGKSGVSNDKGFTDDMGLGTSWVTTGKEGNSLARTSDCVDTDDSGVDFLVESSPTPEAANPEGGSGGGGSEDACLTTEGYLVVNEFMADPAGTDAGFEWIELYNADTVAIDLTGWTLQQAKSSWGTGIALSGIIEPGEFLVVGDLDVTFADILDAKVDLGQGSSSSDGIRINACGYVIDTVIYGDPNSDGFSDDLGGLATSLAPGASDGVSIGRLVDGGDTDECGVDFDNMEFSSPGSSNTFVPECPGRFDVKINEFLADPDSAGGDDGYEWAELYNAGSEPVDLLGWVVRSATSASNGSSFEILESIIIEPGAFVVVGGSQVPEADYVFLDEEGGDDFSLGNASTPPDAIELYCGIPELGATLRADTVVYGGEGDGEMVDDTGEGVVDAVAPDLETGLSLGRCEDGVDSDDSSIDFVVSSANTPGASNAECVPKVCEPDTGVITVNEIFADASGADGGLEWVELYNSSDVAVRIDDWALATATQTWPGTERSFPGGVEVPAKGFLLVGASDVPFDDLAASVAWYEMSGLSLGNAGTPPDGVRLVDCLGAVVDTVLYADSGELENTELLDDAGGQSVVTMHDADRSMGRIPDGADTDDNAADLRTNLNPTPGRANEEGAGLDTGGGSGPGGKGCGKGAASGDADSPSKGCAAVSPVGGLVWLWAGAVLLRRRR